LPSQNEGRPKSQIRHARDQVASKIFHGLLPWAAWLIMTAVFGPLPLFLGRWGWLTAIMVLVPGFALAVFVGHLHRNRASLVGRAIGPATLVAGSAVTAAWLLSGLSVPLAAVWVMGGAAVCIGWDAWLHAAGSHELELMFRGASENAWGAAGRLTVSRPPRAGREAKPGTPAAAPRSRASRVRTRQPVSGTVQLPPEVGAAEAAATVERIEQGLQYPRGSVSMTPAAGNAAFAGWTATDPQVLEQPENWPGPSAPGADMSVPFRYGRFQDGTEVLVPRLDVFHTRTMGTTGTAKTMGHGYCQLGEGVTREQYAALVIDVSKGEQFFGAWRGALHQFETEPQGALALLAGLHRARLARSNYMAVDHWTEWTPQCRLSFLDIFMAEAPDIIRLLPSGKRAQAAGELTLEDWQSDVKNGRSAGESWNLDLQLALATEVPTVSQGQLSYLCMGVETPEEARVGLSSRQLKAGCRPDLWGRRLPGMAYWDAPTLDGRHGVMPLRFYYWQGKARQAFEYAGEYPADARPLDDITGEALAWTAPASPSSAFGLEQRGSAPEQRGNVTPLFRPAKPDQHDEMVKAEKVARDQLAKWLAEGKTTFTSLELQKAKVDVRAGRSRSWLYDVIATFEQTGVIEFMTDKPKKRWRITVPPAAQAPADEEGGA
jgi:hypothetical protein